MPERCYTLMTGATGLVGLHLVGEMLLRGMPLALVVRDSRVTSCYEKVERLMCCLEAKVGHGLARPVVLRGEMTQPGLGLAQEDAQWVAHCCRRIVHSAASMSFKPAHEHPQNEPFRTNIDGLKELMELARTSEISEFHYISTAYVCGRRRGIVLENEADQGQDFANDYEKSKLMAEELLSTYFEQLTVYRPSIVVDVEQYRLQYGDKTIYQAFSVYEYLARYQGIPDVGVLSNRLSLRGTEKKNIVTADWVARIVVEVIARPEFHRQVYHLTHPTGTDIVALEKAFHEVLTRRENEKRRNEKPKNTRSQAGKVVDGVDPVMPSQDVVDQFVTTFRPYFQDDPVFDQSNLKRVLETAGLSEAPEIGVRQIVGLIEKTHQGEKRQPVSREVKSVWMTICQRMGITTKKGFRDHERFGLMLHGQYGGDWTIGMAEAKVSDESEFMISYGGGEMEPRRILASASDWDGLIVGRHVVDDLVSEGRLCLEVDAKHEAIGAAVFKEEVRKLVNRMREAVKAIEIQVVESEHAG